MREEDIRNAFVGIIVVLCMLLFGFLVLIGAVDY